MPPIYDFLLRKMSRMYHIKHMRSRLDQLLKLSQGMENHSIMGIIISLSLYQERLQKCIKKMERRW